MIKKNLIKTSLITMSILTLVFGMTACSSKKNTGNTDTQSVQETKAVVEQTEATIESVKELKTNSLTVTGLSGEADNIKVSDVASDEESYVNVSDKVSDIIDAHVSAMTVYNIDLLKNNVKVQPNGNVKVSIELTEEMLNADGDGYDVLRTEDDNTLTKLSSEVKDSTITFETEHFSIYTIVKTDSTYVAEEPTTEVVTEEVAVNEPDTTPVSAPAETPVISEPVTEAPTEAPAPVRYTKDNPLVIKVANDAYNMDDYKKLESGEMCLGTPHSPSTHYAGYPHWVGDDGYIHAIHECGAEVIDKQREGFDFFQYFNLDGTPHLCG